jgi:hypothetical protein
VSDQIKDANLDLLIGLKGHLDHADRLRGLFDRLVSLSQTDKSRKPHRAAVRTQRLDTAKPSKRGRRAD